MATSMAALLAASLPSATQQKAPAPAPGKQQQNLNVPQRMEEALDVEGEIEVKEVELSSLVILKLLHHSSLPSPPPPATSSSANYQGRDRENHHLNDAVGLLVGVDLSGTMEVSDCWEMPGVDAGGKGERMDANSYSSSLLRHLREANFPDNPIGIYLSTHSTAFSSGGSGVGGTGGFLTRGILELMMSIERVQGGRGRAILLVHDAARGVGGDFKVTAWKFSEGLAAALKKGRFDTLSLIEHKLIPTSLLTPLKVHIKSSSTLTSLLSSLSAPAPPSPLSPLGGPSLLPTPLGPSFLPLQNTTPTSLPITLSSTLSALHVLSQESNNLAYQTRQIAREKSKHDSAVAQRTEENEMRKRQGLQPLPDVAEPRGGKLVEPSRLELLACLGMVDAAAKTLGAEAGKGLVKVYASG